MPDILKLFLPSIIFLWVFYRFVFLFDYKEKQKLRGLHLSFTEEITNEEYVAYCFLCRIDKDSSLWGPAIYNVCSDPDVVRFRELIKDLKSQAADNPTAMKEILGNAYEYVIDL